MSYPPPAQPPAEDPSPWQPPAAQPPAGQPAQPVFQPGVASPGYPQAYPGYPQADQGYPQPSPQYPHAQHGNPPTAAFPAFDPAYNPAYGAPAGPPGRRGGSAGLLWGLIAVFAVLLCAGAGVAGVIAYQNSNDGGVTADPTRPAGRDPLPTGQPAPTPTEEPEEPATGAPSAPARGTITYEVTGDGPASIQYLRDGAGDIEQLTGTKLPWRVEVPRPAGPFVVSLLASREGLDQGKITCRILVDGKQVTKHTAKGALGVAACIDFKFD